MILRKSTARICVFCLCAFTALWPARADVKLHALFTDHMVLQLGMSVPVWGWADDGETVTVEFQNQRRTTKAKNGKWMVKLKKLKAGGPEVLKVTGKNSLTVKDVLIGEVWVASGQSNMEFPLSRSDQSEAAIAQSANPLIRLFTVPKLKAGKPVDNVEAAWKECEPKTVPGFSAVAYVFARDLQKALQVPVGVIHTSWGGSPAEVWIRHDVLADDPDYKRDILDAYESARHRQEEALIQYRREKDQAKQAGKPFNRQPPRAPWQPSELYNGMIAPLLPCAIQGAIWYQGESNAGRAYQYRRLFADMIRNWRKDWGEGSFTFLLVQLAPYDKRRNRSLEDIAATPGESDWAELREAQLLATQNLSKVGMAVITDLGEKDDIHPKKKEPVGARLALAALGTAYGRDLVYSGPVFKKMKVKDDRAILEFDHLGGGLEARGGPLTGFTIAGPDKRFVQAEAQIHGKEIVVRSPQVEKPVAVRFGWADYPIVNLYNKEGLPASPFRTDDFPMVTAPRK
jgi:sialate O-acetylesterase